MTPQTITVIRGDGIGPEIMEAALHVLDAMDVGLSYEFADAGLAALEQTGELLPAATIDSIRRNRIALKSQGETTTVSVLDANGRPEQSINAQRIVKVIADDLK